MGTEVLYPQNCLRSPSSSLSSRSSLISKATGRRKPYKANSYFANSDNHNANCRSSPRSDLVLGSSFSSYTVANVNANANANFRHVRKAVDGGKKRREGGGLVVGEVTILKRGQSLDEKTSRSLTEKKENNENKGYGSGSVADGVLSSEGCGDLMVFGAGRLGPDPVMIPKQIRIGVAGIYAGSVCSSSPSPSSLPLPSFFVKKETCAAAAGPAVNMSATEDLRRLLRLA